MPHPRFLGLPEHCLVDDTLHIRLQGVQRGARVRLSLASAGAPGTVLLAEADFVSMDEDVDLARDAPVSGSYNGVDRMGLFWSRMSRSLASGEAPPEPLVFTLAAREDTGQLIATRRFRRTFLADEVRQHDVRVDGLVARLFTPAGGGAHPTLLVLGGSDGGFSWCAEVAALLASRGFGALALAYFGIDPLPRTLDRIPLEYFGRALAWLAGQEGVDPARVGVVGASRGGELALLLGATFPSIRAVVAYAPSGILWPGVPGPGYAAWSHEGRELRGLGQMPVSEWQGLLAAAGVQDDTPESFQLCLSDPHAVEAATIPVERIGGPVLLVSGQDDRLWPADHLADLVVRRLQRHGFPHDVQHLSYPGAGHAIGVPNLRTTVTRLQHAVTGTVIDLGGTAQANAHASRDSWPRMLDFLRCSL